MDSLIRSWDLHMDSVDEIPSNPPKLQESRKVAQLLDPCLGLAPSPGNLMIAVIRSLDTDLLNPMYQARTQKAAVDFFWTGDQPVSRLSKKQLDSSCIVKGISSLPIGNLSCWKSNILWSLKRYHSIEKPLIIWDILAALLVFKQTAPSFVEHLLLNWLLSWSLGFSSGMSFVKILFHVQVSLPKVSIRQIHLLNIMCRRLLLPEAKEIPKDGTIDNEDTLYLWNELLIHSEKELRSRLVTFSLKALLFLASHVSEASLSNTKWLPAGVAQMEQWVTINKERVEDRLQLLVSEVGELGCRIKSICENQGKEICDFCSAPVPFESPEEALCKATKRPDGSVEIHKLGRCAVSMKLCAITSLQWFCMCCHRWISRLMPSAFFTMNTSTVDVGYAIESFTVLDHTEPLCPFCGILLQRCAPNFLLAANPV